ncbi:hypothetical protein MnTg04_00466 [bacterium MnTg04]|nr:hypothetical protein MnTg04_00466 [bacterium MnTg04]
MNQKLQPTDLRLLKRSRVLEVSFNNGETFALPFEYLRCFSPSAEVRGHGGPMQLVTGKEDVGITAIEPIGQYAVRLVFDDGHDTGLYSWDVLYELGIGQAENWRDYLDRLDAEGYSRRPD